jgi:hypothetical protein
MAQAMTYKDALFSVMEELFALCRLHQEVFIARNASDGGAFFALLRQVIERSSGLIKPDRSGGGG